jgi:hypothetical protein
MPGVKSQERKTARAAGPNLTRSVYKLTEGEPPMIMFPCRREHLPLAFVITALATSAWLVAAESSTSASSIRTRTPEIYGDWKKHFPKAKSDDEVRREAERHRSRVQGLKDPFTPLISMTCPERAAERELVPWEDARAMAVVDFSRRDKLLIIPKRLVPNEPVNFPIDLWSSELDHMALVAAAACDALVEAGGREPSKGEPSCDMHIHPPSGLGVARLHVHVEPLTTTRANQAFYGTVTARMKVLLGGSGCDAPTAAAANGGAISK